MRGAAVFPLCERMRARAQPVLWRIRAYQILCCAENRPAWVAAHRPAGNCL